MGEYVGAKRLDVFVYYVLSRSERDAIEKVYRIYVTDHLRALCGSPKRWIEYIEPDPDINADEIAADIIKRAGLEFE